jgi:hypothetical protein
MVAQGFKQPAISFKPSRTGTQSIHPETKEAAHIIISGLLPIKKVFIHGWEGSSHGRSFFTLFYLFALNLKIT